MKKRTDLIELAYSAGQMGTGLISQRKMHGLKIVAVSDIMTRAHDAYIESDVEADKIHWEDEDLDKANQLILEDQRVATHSSDFLVQIKELDAIVECTGIPNVGAVVFKQAIEFGKPINNMNVEKEATIG